MVVLKKLPSLQIIDGFKGVIDFYVYKGLNCVRTWPKKPSMPRSPASTATALIFGYAAHYWNALSPEVQQAYNDTASGSSLTGRDLFVKSFIKSYFRPGQFF